MTSTDKSATDFAQANDKTRPKLRKLVSLAGRYRAPILALLLIGAAVVGDALYRSNATNYYQEGLQAMQAAKYDKAIDLFSRVLRQAPEDAAARAALGWAYHSKGWVDEALKQYDTAAQGSRESLGLAYFNSGVVYYSKRKLDLAETAYLNAIQVNPRSFGPNYNIGFVYLDRGMPEKALPYFLKAAEIDAKSAPATFNAGVAYERTGRKAEAKKFYERTLAIDSNFGAARDKLKQLAN